MKATLWTMGVAMKMEIEKRGTENEPGFQDHPKSKSRATYRWALSKKPPKSTDSMIPFVETRQIRG